MFTLIIAGAVSTNAAAAKPCSYRVHRVTHTVLVVVRFVRRTRLPAYFPTVAFDGRCAFPFISRRLRCAPTIAAVFAVVTTNKPTDRRRTPCFRCANRRGRRRRPNTPCTVTSSIAPKNAWLWPA